MNMDSVNWLAPLVSVDSPVLPSPWVMQWWLYLGWSVVLVWGFSALGKALPQSLCRVGAGLLALWCWVPGPYSPAYWLGLAFQAPSISSVLLCCWLLRESLVFSRVAPSASVPTDRRVLVLATLGILVGWALLLDTFAVLPVSLYVWGFSPIAPALVLLVALVPWVLGYRHRSLGPKAWVAPIAVLLFVALRLPTGNTWAAMLDPGLWLVLHGCVFRAVFRRTIRLKSAH